MEMKRKIGILFAGIALALGIVAGHASADNGHCSGSGPDRNQFSWIGAMTGNVYFRTGTNAVINPASSAFTPCTGSTVDGLSTAWVALTPPVITDENAIAQIGWLKSNVGICNGGNDKWCIIWATGGCGIDPIATDTGAIETTNPNHAVTFQVERSGGYMHFYYDLNGGHNYFDFADISTSDAELSCWANGNLQSAFLAERHNPYDGVGTEASPSKWTDMTTKYNGSWVTNNPAGCNWIGANGSQGGDCSFPTAGQMNTWNDFD